MKLRWKTLVLLCCTALCFPDCQKNNTTASSSGESQFELLRKDVTGLDFVNNLRQNGEFNVFNYMYFFNGGGVATGDFNNDGLPDLYFVNNMGPNKMFLNEGNLKFKDITEAAGTAGATGWTSGVSVVDINNDGLLDLYVGMLGNYQGIQGQNQLFVCQGIQNGIPTYEDEAVRYGLDLVGFSTQATFFDYDLDGDLDLFQLNHSLHQNGTFGQRATFKGQLHPMAGDKFFRNDKGKFVNITEKVGINSSVIGYGLGVVTGDVNNDGYPDIYIGNDFHENDYLYINQGNGTFKEMLPEMMMHTSQFSMGVDMSDINNDGWQDIISLDMLPEDPYILKSSLGEDTWDLYHFKLGFGYHYQYTRNNLQLNNGDGTFSEIGLFAGVAATDWSWSPLFMDFDHDGYKDLFISNGIPRRMNDIDYVKFQEERQMSVLPNGITLEEKELQAVEKMPRIKLANKFFKNTGKLTFDDLEKQVDNNLPTFSTGAVYADFDGDGDLDVVVNNQEDEPFLYKNLCSDQQKSGHDFLSFQFRGQPENIHGIGAKVLIYRKNGEKNIEEFYPVRGYQSSALIPLHIGIGDRRQVDSVLLIWPDRGCQRVQDLQYNQTQTLSWQAGLPKFDYARLRARAAAPYTFRDVTAGSGLTFQHKENPFVQFNRERLIPNMVSTEGPALAVGDVNGDGLEDVFLGSAKRERSALFIQTAQGTFTEKTPAAILADSLFEDVDAVFADLENDGDLDLVIAAGGDEYRGQDEPMQQRAYLNDGKGNFSRSNPFPTLFMTASCVLPTDFNQDGLTDFFFGGRAIPWKYGLTPNSYLMINKGNGQFEDATASVAPELGMAGMVKNGAWADMDGDGRQDLVLAIEWEPVTIFYNRNGKLEKKPLDQQNSWWNFAQPADLDGDGDLDILAGNTGMNSRLKPSEKEPVELYVADFDNSGNINQMMTYYVKGKKIPFSNHEETMKALPSLKKKFLYAKDFAKAGINDLFSSSVLDKAVKRRIVTLQSVWYENLGNGKFEAHVLPDRLQWSSLQTAALYDLDNDGKKEVITAGNFYDCNIEMGRYDNDFGHVLKFRSGGQVDFYPLGDLRIRDQVRRIEAIQIKSKTAFIFARNNQRALLVEPETTVQ
jgi:enediyne biosynthesis protein E4